MSIAGKVGVYRQKPFFVKAIQWTGDNTAEVQDFLGADFKGINAAMTHIWVKNPLNAMALYIGAYAVRDESGGCYVVSEKVFERIYELVGKE